MVDLDHGITKRVSMLPDTAPGRKHFVEGHTDRVRPVIEHGVAITVDEQAHVDGGFCEIHGG
tara:strand:- start:446 stop:631 length:186 start_codon:yes stop_codon:yes gene_type:complete